ncbi:hypothetical protein BGP79_11130 [Tersicoccus sp. Bi-70]|nr:hypothetical protein BGP79_11130 [Tersicoccus sp. Bi-70]
MTAGLAFGAVEATAVRWKSTEAVAGAVTAPTLPAATAWLAGCAAAGCCAVSAWAATPDTRTRPDAAATTAARRPTLPDCREMACASAAALRGAAVRWRPVEGVDILLSFSVAGP